MKAEHDLLVKKATEALRDIYFDTTVSPVTVLKSLEQLNDETHKMVVVTEWDIKNKPKHESEP